MTEQLSLPAPPEGPYDALLTFSVHVFRGRLGMPITRRYRLLAEGTATQPPEVEHSDDGETWKRTRSFDVLILATTCVWGAKALADLPASSRAKALAAVEEARRA